jgi:hypothetical protein
MQRAQKLAIRLNRSASGDLWPESTDPLAMQKVVGSSPIIRFFFFFFFFSLSLSLSLSLLTEPRIGGFYCCLTGA